MTSVYTYRNNLFFFSTNFHLIRTSITNVYLGDKNVTFLDKLFWMNNLKLLNYYYIIKYVVLFSRHLRGDNFMLSSKTRLLIISYT